MILEHLAFKFKDLYVTQINFSINQCIVIHCSLCDNDRIKRNG